MAMQRFNKLSKLAKLVLHASIPDVYGCLESFLTEEDQASVALSRMWIFARGCTTHKSGDDRPDTSVIHGLYNSRQFLHPCAIAIINVAARTFMCQKCGIRPMFNATSLNIWSFYFIAIIPDDCSEALTDKLLRLDEDDYINGPMCQLCACTGMMPCKADHDGLCWHLLLRFRYTGDESTQRYCSRRHHERIQETLEAQGYIVCLHCKQISWRDEHSMLVNFPGLTEEVRAWLRENDGPLPRDFRQRIEVALKTDIENHPSRHLLIDYDNPALDHDAVLGVKPKLGDTTWQYYWAGKHPVGVWDRRPAKRQRVSSDNQYDLITGAYAEVFHKH